MSSARIEIELSKLLLSDESKRESSSFIEEKSLESKDQDISEYVSDTSWEDMPKALKQTMGIYLLKPNTPYPQSTIKQAKVALRDRKNIDLPYMDRSDDDVFEYTKKPCLTACGHCNDGSNPDNQSCFDGTGYLSRGYHANSLPEYACRVAAVPLIGCPVGIIHVAVGTPFGLFIDCGRAIKRKCDNNQDEALHRTIVGGPARQQMK